LVPVLAADELSDEAREGLALIHPSFMDGDYLPGDRPNEVEIAGIELDAITNAHLSACELVS
jgi:hypothetical protein